MSEEAAVAAEVAEASEAAGLDGAGSEPRRSSEPSQHEILAVIQAQQDSEHAACFSSFWRDEEMQPLLLDVVQEIDVTVVTRIDDSSHDYDGGNNALGQLTRAAQMPDSTLNESEGDGRAKIDPISSITGGVISTLSVEKSDENCDDAGDKFSDIVRPVQSFRHFQQCPTAVRQRILGYLVVKDTSIKPYYNHGSVSVFESQDLKDDFDVSMLFVGNKQFYGDASAALYGLNQFAFHDPKIALWWFRQIGSNVKKIRRASFFVSEGVSRHHNDCTGVRLEKHWSMLFHWLQRRHELKAIHVSLKKWNYVGYKGTSLLAQSIAQQTGGSTTLAAQLNRNNIRSEPDFSAQYLDIEQPREETLVCLLKYRGLEEAEIAPGPYANSRPMCDIIADAMELDQHETTGELEQLSQRYDAALVRAGKKRKKYDVL